MSDAMPMTRKDLIDRIVMEYCIIAAMLTVIPFVVRRIPEMGGHHSASTITHFRWFWWACMAVNISVMTKKKLLGGNLFGTLLVIIFGPVTMLAVVYRRIVRRIWSV